MTLNGYSIYDRKSGIFHAPFFAVSAGAAVRSFSDLVNDPGTTVGRHPSDYALYTVGAFDDQSGELLPVSPAQHISDAITLVRQSGPLPLVAK